MFREATSQFQEALRHTDSRTDPAMYNLLSGLVKLSESLQALDGKVEQVLSNTRN